MKQLKSYILLAITIGWLYLMFVSIEGNTPLGSLFWLVSSPAKSDFSFNESRSNLKNPYGKADVGFDRYGVPTIFADNSNAAAFALGYAHANDRLFQIEMLMRTVKGRLAEVAGEKAISSDLFWRKFGFETKAATWFQTMLKTNPTEAKRCKAYADGINSYIQTCPEGSIPLEFYLLGFKPSEFKPENLFLLLRYMDYSLNYDEEDLELAEVRKKISPELYNRYYPSFHQTEAVSYPSLNINLSPQIDTSSLPSDIASIPSPMRVDAGSNNWAVGRSKISGGGSMLCNDPHLKLALPGTWYEASMVINGRVSRGFTIPGSPYIISGYTDSLAWGMTNATWNLTEITTAMISGDKAVVNNASLSIKKHDEVIDVRGRNSIVYEVKETPQGILDTVNGSWIQIQWIGLTESYESSAFGGLLSANSVEEALNYLKDYQQPPQNFVLADAKGNIGLNTVGAYFRKEDRQFVLLNEKLRNINPSSGYVFSANQAQVKGEQSGALNRSFAAEARAARIRELLSSKPVLDANDMMRIQTDIVDGEWNDYKTEVVAAIRPINKSLADLLKNWHGVASDDSYCATVFTEFRRKLLSEATKALVGEVVLGPETDVLKRELLSNSVLPGINGTVKVDSLFKKVGIETIATLVDSFGRDYLRWNYGRVHKTELKHIASIPGMNAEPIITPGTTRSINVSSGRNNTHGASMRTMIKFEENGVVARLILCGGQSGRFNSPNYKDQLSLWAKGLYRLIRQEKTYIQSHYHRWYEFKS